MGLQTYVLTDLCTSKSTQIAFKRYDKERVTFLFFFVFFFPQTKQKDRVNLALGSTIVKRSLRKKWVRVGEAKLNSSGAGKLFGVRALIKQHLGLSHRAYLYLCSKTFNTSSKTVDIDRMESKALDFQLLCREGPWRLLPRSVNASLPPELPTSFTGRSACTRSPLVPCATEPESGVVCRCARRPGRAHGRV